MSVMDARLATPEELCRVLGERLRAQRLAQALTQQELAARCGISIGALKKLETDGKATVLTLLRTVTGLGLAGELESLFALRPHTSIAEMERAERAKRIRAPRKSRP